MEVERISENKIKVLIDNQEAKELNISEKMLARNTPEIQRMFRRAIAIAEERMDFSIEGAKLFVETIPSYTDGIGMLITKVCTERELQTAVDNCSYKGKIKRNEIQRAGGKSRRIRKYIYKFASFDDVCSAANRLNGNIDGISSLYKLDEEYYLYVLPASPIFMTDADTVLTEYSEKVSHGQYIHGRLNEYGTLMIEGNALTVLNKYFD